MMHYRPEIKWARIVIALFLACCNVLLILCCAVGAEAATHSGSVSATNVSSPSTIASSSPTSDSTNFFINVKDPNIQGALIGSLVTIIITVFGGFTAIVQRRKTKKEEKRREESEEKRVEEQKKHQRELLEIQRTYQREIETEKLRMASEIRAQEEDIKRKEREDQIRREMMERASSIEQRALVYRAAFNEDPHIAHLQILGMTRPLKMRDVFVPMRVRLDERSQAKLDQVLHELEDQHDTELFLRAQQDRLQRRFSDALDPLQAIHSYGRCVILGDPGAGKTTLLKYLALAAISNEFTSLPDLPIYIDLNKFIGSLQQDLLEFAAYQWEQEYNFPRDDALHYMMEKLNNGEAVLFLDALDETLIGTTAEDAEESYKSVVNKIVIIAKRYYKSRVVVTARKAGYRQRKMITGFHQLEILEFRPEDITKFINNWFGAEQKPQRRIRAIDLNKKLEYNSRLHALASNPLLLSLIVILYEEQNMLPDNKAELYKRCVDTLLFEWDARHDVPLHSELSKGDKRQLLSEIAWHFQRERKRYFTEDELLKVIGTFLLTLNRPDEKSRDILNEITNIHGLLKLQAWQLYGFLHVSFQEYFAAEYARECHLLDTLLDHVGDSSWEEMIALYASQVPDASLLLQKLINPDRESRQQEDIFYTNLLLAGRCLGDHTRIQQLSLRDEIVSRLFNILLSTHMKLTREQIIYVLVSIGDKAVIARLLQLLADENVDQYIRWKIAEIMGTAGKPALAFELLPLLSNEKIDAGMREIIAEALGRLGNQRITYQLLRLLDTLRSEQSVSQCIVRSLGTLADTQIAYSLLERLENLRIEVGLRCSIAEALAFVEDDVVIDRLLSLLVDEDVNPRVRCSISDALGKMSKPQTTVAVLLDLLMNKEVERSVRCHVANTLGKLGEQSSISRLEDLRIDPRIDLQVRASITIALGMLGKQAVIVDLLNILKDPTMDLYLLRSIPDVLGVLGERSIQPQLLSLLSDTGIDRSVRRSIANTLSKLGGLPICHDLFDMLSQERIDPGVRQCIATTIGKLGEYSMASSLFNLLANKHINQYVRMSIAEAITLLGEKTVAYRLFPLLMDKGIELQVRQSIAKAVGALSYDRVAVEELATCLVETDIPENIFYALWTVSRRYGVRVFSKQNLGVKHVTGYFIGKSYFQ